MYNKIIVFLLFLSSVFCCIHSECDHDLNSMGIYPSVVEKILFFKDDKFKVFYGGPINRSNGGVRWIMPVTMEDDDYRTRAVYEVSFINCDLTGAQDAEILFIDVSDINIKLKNISTPDYHIFSHLMNGEYHKGKYIVVRFTDIANTYYPDIFISSVYSKRNDQDKKQVVKFLHEKFKTQDTYIDYYVGEKENVISFEDKNEIIYKSQIVRIDFNGNIQPFNVIRIIKKNDIWKVYYLISKASSEIQNLSNETLLRFDSGCVSGQIYDDEACDCLDQLHDSLKKLSETSDNSILIHIPAHDGRGFGTAPKAETEIYKIGGLGRVHTSIPLDTVKAAKLLYGNDNYDLRTYDGACEILHALGIKKVFLVTDNKLKVSTIIKHGIEVTRVNTDTEKHSCLNHIQSKKDSPLYYAD